MSAPPPLPPPAMPPRPDYAGPRTLPPQTLFDVRAFVRQLVGWALASVVLVVPCLFILPRYEEQLKDFKIELPALTALTLYAARLVRSFWFLLIPCGLAHASIIAVWYPHAGLTAQRVYRLLLSLVVCLLFAAVILALYLPVIALNNALSGVRPK